MQVHGAAGAIVRQMLIAAEQQLQGVIGLRQLALTFGDIGAGAFDHAARLFQRQHGGAPGQQLFFNEGVRLLIVLQGVVGHLQLRCRQPLVEVAL